MDELTLIACSYNTPDVTITMIRSWFSVHYKTQRVLICDNSTDIDTSTILKENNIPFITMKGSTHGDGVNRLINECKTKYALLVDTDIIFLKDHESIFEKFKEQKLTIMGKVEGDRGGKSIYNRVNPWHCFINIEDIKNNNITFFDEGRMRKSFTQNKIYDIGSTFFEDIKDKKLKIGNIDLTNKYYFHFEGMSWYKNKFNSSQEDTGIDFGGTHNNYAYVKAHEQKYLKFKEVEKTYANINIKGKCI